jgi:hypothetical protein
MNPREEVAVTSLVHATVTVELKHPGDYTINQTEKEELERERERERGREKLKLQHWVSSSSPRPICLFCHSAHSPCKLHGRFHPLGSSPKQERLEQLSYPRSYTGDKCPLC